MKNHARRIEKVEAELNSARPDDSAWWENFKKRDREGAMIHVEFFEKHADDPKFQKESTEDKWSDETINEFADYVLKRTYELMPSEPTGGL
jgi:hypothetical protein